MKLTRGAAALTLMASGLAVGLTAAGSAVLSGAAKADTAVAARPLQVSDFTLPDQAFLAHQLYRMRDAKAVVLMTYASGDAQVHKDAAGLMALKRAYADKGVEVFLLDSRLGDKREAVIPDVKGAGIDAPILFDYEQFVG